MKRIPPVILGPLVGVLLAGCETERPPLGQPVCNAWKSEVSALVTDQCVECHSATNPEGGYALDTYLSAVALDANGLSRIRGGDATSPVLTIFSADAVHGALRSAAEEPLTLWVVDCGARYVETELHAANIMNPGHTDFHGELVADAAYDLSACTKCHGEDLEGGGAGPGTSCKTCHPDGESGCTSCHGDLMEKGAHAAHLLSPILGKPTGCETCHVVPEGMQSAGHIDPPPVEVTLSGNAIDPAAGQPAPTFDAASQQCNNTYCHLGTRDDSEATASSPRWTDTASVTCTSCHGFPPAQHPDDRCQRCHQPTVGADGTLADLSLHLDRQVQLGDPAKGCGGCHLAPDTTEPFVNLDGESDPTLVTVGAHDAHRYPQYGLRGPMACSECHLVPTDVRDPGHLDAPPVEVFPTGSSTLAYTDSAQPSWDRTTATCSQVYCHGAGTKLEADQSEGTLRNPVWNTPTTQQVYCGSCHGAPPTTSVHPAFDRLDQCVMCHSESVDAFGNPILTGPPEARTSEHIDGQTPL